MHIFKSGLQNDFELLTIFNYRSLNYRGSTVFEMACFRNDVSNDRLKFFLFRS